MFIGIGLAIAISLSPISGSGLPSLERVRSGDRCTATGALAFGARWLLGCKQIGNTTRWVRTKAKLAPPRKQLNHSANSSPTATSSQQRTALVLRGEIIGVINGSVTVGFGLEAMELSSSDPAQLGERFGANRIVIPNVSQRILELNAYGCLATNCGHHVRDYALLNGEEVLNVIVWDGRPLLGLGTQISSEVQIIERRIGEPIGPGTRILQATNSPLIPDEQRGNFAILKDNVIVAVLSGTANLLLPRGLELMEIFDADLPMLGWVRSAEGYLNDRTPSNDNTDDAAPSGPTSEEPNADHLPSDATAVAEPFVWRLSADRANAWSGGPAAYAIVYNNIVLNVVILDPSAANGQSWLQAASGSSQLPEGAYLVERSVDEPIGPGTRVEVEN